MKKTIIVLFILALLLTGCTAREDIESISKTDFYFDTVVTITLLDSTDNKILEECFKICNVYEMLFSKKIETSDIAILNRDKQLEVNNIDTIYLLEKAIYYSTLTDGKFDITISNLSDLWNFTSENPSIPNITDIENTLSDVDYQNINIESNIITITNPDTSIDLGAIAKGFIADKLKEYLLSQNINSALIDLGGNIIMIGNKPDNQPFLIGVQKPFAKRNESIAIVKGSDISLVSSGSYERYFKEGDKLYHHILDTKTGYPCDNGLQSVTILSRSSLDGDALSTSCFALGLEDGLALIERLDNIEAIFIDEKQTITLSSGLVMEDNIISFVSPQ